MDFCDKLKLENWEPKVPSQEILRKQAKMQLKMGKSTGNIRLDIEALNALKNEEKDKEDR